MKGNFLLFFVLMLMHLCLNAQKVVDRVIDNDDRRKVERARKLYNQLKIFDGEKMLKDLVKQNPNNVYFHEALVQMQRQVLYRIRYAGSELSEFYSVNNETDSGIDEADEEQEPTEKANANPEPKMTTREIYESLGLDMTKINDREKQKKDKANQDTTAEATVTIDPALMYDEDGLDEEEDDAVKKLDKETKRKLKTLSSFAEIPYDAYLADMIQNARNATRLFPNADSSSLYLRQFLIDTADVNAEVYPEAMSVFRQGLEAYAEKEIPAAAKFFEKALATDEVFYSAYLKLGDTYFMMNKDTACIKQYQLASAVNNRSPDPLERLAIMYYNRGKYTEAGAAILNAIMKYPQHQYFGLLKRIVEKNGIAFDAQWIRREVYPLTTAHVYEEIMATAKSPWWHYQASKQDVHSYFDTLGLVRPNEKTRERYLEVYGWKKMLNNSSPKLFQFARAMEKIGYLDCYVLISLFHNDLYGQFSDLVSREPDKVKKYFYMLINWEDKKYDKLRKSVQVAEKKDEPKTAKDKN